MAVKRISSESLIDLAISTVRGRLSPALPAELRYEAAMAINALEIARREIASEGDTALWKLLDKLYDDGDGSSRKLADDIRANRLNEQAFPGLGAALLGIVQAELAVRNPRFLAALQA